MKKFINKKVLLIFLALVISATILSAYLNSIGYEGMLYFQTVYNNNGHKSYGNYSPRTGGFLVTGIALFYISIIWKKMNKFDNILVKRAIGTLLIIAITIFVIGGIDLVSAIAFIFRR
ncbi:hypothetical protein [Enterococcus ureasiticus]|uniref:Uncharacterized protein n=1 Tax=Enterococcus ureasiticus TaxID=903984 RepID=A0A1E5GL65_9ENTE|nr:hypothetical protein [Enterococcus ureasiticus]OEG13438.1 hypothetical protein BCR21_00130 [Enterococcus ureasiticus]